MATQEQFNPFSEEHDEEKQRLYDNDKHSHNYKAVEDIADDEPLPDQFEEKEKQEAGEHLEENFAGEDFPDFEDKELNDEEKIAALEKEIKAGVWPLTGKDQLAKLKKELTEKNHIGFHQGNGVASVGPDAGRGEEVMVGHMNNSHLEASSMSETRKENADFKASKTAASIVEPVYHEQRKDRRKRSAGHDNIKTLPISKKERSIRAFLRGLFHTDKKGDPDEEKFDIVGDSFDSVKFDPRDSLADFPDQTKYRKYSDEEDAA